MNYIQRPSKAAIAIYDERQQQHFAWRDCRPGCGSVYGIGWRDWSISCSLPAIATQQGYRAEYASITMLACKKSITPPILRRQGPRRHAQPIAEAVTAYNTWVQA